MMEPVTNQVLTYDLRCGYLQLPQFNKKWEECENYFEQWIYILKNMHKFEEFPVLNRKDEVFQRLEKIASYSALSEEDKIAYEADLKWASEYEEEIATAKREAIEEGRLEGRAEGELIKASEMALKMKEKGFPINDIAELTGLSLQELQERC